MWDFSRVGERSCSRLVVEGTAYQTSLEIYVESASVQTTTG